jgi:hypothetical protein
LGRTSQGKWVVQYLSQEEADEALAAIPAHTEWTVMPTARKGIAVYQFRIGVTEAEVRLAFPTALIITIDKPKPGYRPTAFVSFSGADDIDEITRTGEETFSEDLRLQVVDQALESREAFQELKKKDMKFQTDNTVYIKGLEKDARREDVVQMCREYGKMNSCVFLVPKAGRPYAIVAFAEKRAYEMALQAKPTGRVQMTVYRLPTGKGNP